MSSRRNVAVAASLVLVGAAAFWWWRQPGPEPLPSPPPAVDRPAPTPPAAAPVNPPATPPPSAATPSAGTPAPAAAPAATTPPAERSHLADRLNAPDGTITQDAEIVLEVLQAWRTNFRQLGNPVGENREITAALTGKNRIDFAFIPADHPAINAQGELCDRWGTPFFFHQISGTRMEIRSAGPDRKLYTADDTVLAPASATER